MADQQSARDITKRMYETGEWSDFKVHTSTRTFNVHKSVLSAASPYFKAGSQDDWREAQDGGIRLPENETVVDAVLRCCYGIFDVTKAANATYNVSDHVGCTITFLEILIAADKYQLPALREELIVASWDVINDHYSDTCVDLAKWAYQEERRFALGRVIMQKLVDNIACEMQGVLMQSSHQWDRLMECPELLKDVVRCLARSPDITNEPEDWEEPDYLEK